MDVTIRKATINDVKNLALIFDSYRVWYDKKSDIPKAVEYLRDRISKNESIVYLAETNHKLVGFTQLYPLFSSTRLNRVWLLNDLFVSEDVRGKGIAIKLIKMAQQLATETKSCGLMLETDKSNTVGNKLYQKMGFVLQDYSNFYNWAPENYK